MSNETDPRSFAKTSSESFAIDFNFYNRMPPSSASVSSATLSAEYFDERARQGGTDYTSTVLQSSTGVPTATTKVRAIVKSGTTKSNYKIKCLATLDDGSIVELSTVMKVRD